MQFNYLISPILWVWAWLLVVVAVNAGKDSLKSTRVFLYPSTARRLLADEMTANEDWMKLPRVKRALSEGRLLRAHVRGILYTAKTGDDDDATNEDVAKNVLVRGYAWLTGQSLSIDGNRLDNTTVTPKVLARRLRLFRTDAVETPRRGGSVRLRVWPNVEHHDTKNETSQMPLGASLRVNVDARQLALGRVTVRTNDEGYFDALLYVELVDKDHSLHSEDNQGMLPENWVRMPIAALTQASHGSASTFYLNAGALASDEKEDVDKLGHASVGLTMAQAPVVVMNDERPGLIVITDIDDTIKVSNITGSLVDIAKAAFTMPYLAVDGMAALFRNWTLRVGIVNPILRDLNSDNASVSSSDSWVPTDTSYHYVTGVSWPLVPSYDEELLQHFGFPIGSIWARSTLLDIKDSVVSWARQFNPLKQLWRKIFGKEFDFRVPSDSRTKGTTKASATYYHKMRSIQYLLDDAPVNSSVIMIGDSTQHDPEIYADITRLYGWSGRPTSNQTDSVFSRNGRIGCVFIRAVVPIKKPPSTDMTPVLQAKGKCANLSDTEACTPSQTVQEQVFIQELLKRLRSIFENVPDFEERVRVFRSGSDLASVDVASGKCY